MSQQVWPDGAIERVEELEAILREYRRRVAELKAENDRVQQLIREAIIWLEDGVPYTAIDRLERALAPKEPQ